MIVSLLLLLFCKQEIGYCVHGLRFSRLLLNGINIVCRHSSDKCIALNRVQSALLRISLIVKQ